LLEALGVAVDRADHARPRLLDDEDAALPVRHVMPRLVDDRGLDAGERQRARAGHQRRGVWQRRDDVAAGLRLPEGVDDRAAASGYVGTPSKTISVPPRASGP